MTTSEQNYHQTELQTPAWLNTDFFVNALNHYEQTGDVKLKSLKFTPDTAKREHFGSMMFRTTIVYQTKVEIKAKSLIIKIMPENEGKTKKDFEESKLFETEIGIYSKVLPKFRQILQEMGDNAQLGATCIYHALTPKKVIIFEDLVPFGYAALRDQRPNLEEAKVIFSQIAKWHAISFKINKEEPHFFDEFRYSFFMEPNFREYKPFYEGLDNFIELLETVEDLKAYKPYFEAFRGNIMQKVVKNFREARDNPKTQALYVLCHGDFHHKNLMFKNDAVTQKFLDIILLDFQMSYLGPMVNDILNATYMMFDAEMRAKYLDELYYGYFVEFQATLQKINYAGEIPKIIDFRKELMRHKDFALYQLFFCLPMWNALLDSANDPDVLYADKEGRKMAWRNTAYINEVKQLLPKFLHSGYLEL